MNAPFRRPHMGGLILVALMLVSCCTSLAFGAEPAKPLEPVTLQLKWRHQFQFAGYYMALEKGYYRDAGFDVRIVEAREGRDPVMEVVEGRANFGVGTSELVVTRSLGHPVVVLAAIFQHSPMAFLATRKSGIESVHDLAGKRVMVEPQAAELLAYLKDEGVDLNGIVRVPHTFDPMALLEGRVDAMSAYTTDEPFLLRQHDVDYVLIEPRAGGIDFYGDCLFTTQGEIDARPDRVRAFRDASLRGWAYALDDPSQAIGVILSRYSQRHTRGHLKFEAKATRKLIKPEAVRLGYMNPGRWRAIADTYTRMDMMPPGFSLNGFLYEPDPGCPVCP